MTVHSNEWLKANFLQRDPQDWMTDLIDSIANSDWSRNVTAYYVDSTDSDASDSNTGTDREYPLATLEGAFNVSGLTAGDIIYVMPGHTETYSTTGVKCTLDVAGVNVVCLGSGSKRPTFTFGHTGATWTWSGAGITLCNALFVTSVDSVTTFATISGADATLIGCETRDTTDIEVITDFTVTGDRLHVYNHYKNGYVGGNANARVFSLAGVDGAYFEGCRFITKVTTAVIGTVSTACSGVVVRKCDFYVNGTSMTKDVVDGAGGSVWGVTDCFDLNLGGSFSGGSGAALASDDISTAYTLLTSSATSVGTAQISTTSSSATSIQTNLTSSATSVGTAVGSIQTNLTSSASSVGTQVGSIQTNLTSSATSVGTDQLSSATSVGTQVGSIQTNLTSSATSVGTDQLSSATSVGTQVGSIQTNLTSSATSIGTDLASDWASWATQWSTAYDLLMSAIAST